MYFLKIEMNKLNSKKINIGNGSGSLITNYAVKSHIIKYLYEYYDNVKHSYKYLQTFDDLYYLKNNKHYVSFLFNGFDYFLMFLRYKELMLCILVDKKDLKDDYLKINYNDLKLISIPVRIKQDAYNGSIFSGRIIRNNRQSVFLIDNCFCLDGNNTIELDLEDKLHMVDNYINTYHIDDEHMDVFSLRIMHLYGYEELHDMVYVKMKKSDMDILGLMFHPSRTDHVYIFDSNKTFSTKELEAIFTIKKTHIPDVYELHVYSGSDKQKYDIALIPTLLCSHFCNTLLENIEECNVVCKYSHHFNKWEPISISTDKINTEDEINNKMKSVNA